MRHASTPLGTSSVLRLATLLSLGGAAMMVLITVALPEQSAFSAALVDRLPMQERAARLLYRRQYNEKVLAECQRRVTAGETIECPNINDIDAIREFLSSDPVEVVDHSAGVTITKDDLDDQQLALLRRLQRVGSCPDTLDSIMPGFYELCVQTVGSSGERGTMQRLLQGIPQSSPPEPTWTLQERIEQSRAARP